MHAKAEDTGLIVKQITIGKDLIDMYVNCGFLTKAQQVFDTSLLHEKAPECFEQMKLEGVPADHIAYLSIMKACISIGEERKTSELHNDIEKLGLLQNNPFLGSTGCMEKAQQVFGKIQRQNVVTWTVLITGYAEHGYGEKKIECFQQMQLEGISPNGLTFVALHAKGEELHVMIDRMGLLSGNTILGSTLVDMHAKHGLLQKTFNTVPFPDVIAWTALVSGYVETGLGEEALKCFEQMQFDCIPPDAIAYNCCLKVCYIADVKIKGLELHSEIEKKGLHKNDIIQKTLVDMHARFGSLVNAQVQHN